MQENIPENSKPQSRQVTTQPADRRRFFRRALTAAASLIGAGALLKESSGSALASGPGSFSSSVSTTPAVKATGTKGAKGVVASSDTSTGVSGTSSSGTGLSAQSTSGLGAHVVGGGATSTTPSFKEAAIFAEGGPGYGVYATSTSGTGLYAQSGTSVGAHVVGGGASPSTPPTKEAAIFAEGGPSHGVYAQSSSGNAVWGQSSNATGVLGISITATGVYAQSSSGIGAHVVGGGANGTMPSFTEAAIFAEGGPSYALYATNNGPTDTIFVQNADTSVPTAGLHAVAAGVTPSSPTSTSAIFAEGGPGPNVGVFVTTQEGDGVVSINNGTGQGISLYGRHDNGISVYGQSNSGDGIYGFSSSGTGVYSGSDSGLAGDFNGNVQVSGTLSKGGGSFQIDHPQDPAHKYLSHSFVESPDMKNIYDGVVTLDANGQAEITLPSWFSVLNRDFRYQLTCLGGYAPVYIAQELQNNHFTIAGGKAGMKVSWMVTGIRQDPWANAHRIPVEQDKPTKEQGYYLHPDLYGQPADKGIYNIRHPRPKTPVALKK